jgi:phage terminase large subunit-like protein
VQLSWVQQAVERLGPEAFYNALTPEERAALPHRWEAWARPNQLAPGGDWRFGLWQAGRGFGKTRTGAEWVRQWNRRHPGTIVFLVAETPAQARDVMIQGPAGLLSICPPEERPLYEPSKRQLTFPLREGQPTICKVYSARNHEELRGPQCHAAWLDELAKWKYAQDAFDNLNLGLRLGRHPQAVITTTPRNVAVIRKLRKDPRCVVIRGSTFDNEANLAADFLADIRDKYEGTRLGRQELAGELLEDTPGALWQRAGMIDKHRVKVPPAVIGADGRPMVDREGLIIPKLDLVAVGVDPSVAEADDDEEDQLETAECGIIVAGRSGYGIGAHYYVLEDASIYASPDKWARAAVWAYANRKANFVVAEENNGGKLVELALRQVDPLVKYKGVHASRGKMTRAEPISMLYEQGRVHHVGTFERLEDQMCQFVPGQSSPDRMDALVWALSELSQAEDASARTRLLLG